MGESGQVMKVKRVRRPYALVSVFPGRKSASDNILRNTKRRFHEKASAFRIDEWKKLQRPRGEEKEKVLPTNIVDGGLISRGNGMGEVYELGLRISSNEKWTSGGPDWGVRADRVPVFETVPSETSFKVSLSGRLAVIWGPRSGRVFQESASYVVDVQHLVVVRPHKAGAEKPEARHSSGLKLAGVKMGTFFKRRGGSGTVLYCGVACCLAVLLVLASSASSPAAAAAVAAVDDDGDVRLVFFFVGFFGARCWVNVAEPKQQRMTKLPLPKPNLLTGTTAQLHPFIQSCPVQCVQPVPRRHD
ncbi:hypothetical protein PAAG_03337 [Paracoccidioides lutzii Pb01]|uniref:Uncharacterized protein n=1 Tax=Paracoccidioides lutzii (strain ATCC MYA-826 / Pb01) TaxID=502779 RepID=C1GWW3_PARBA|nr:hypothetical protein PAAG_03337 [Paracoccidioides lutzii Pb01]EEH41051.2 hypothetical protein PAAG_03337 [Paracoccidioides lutzii Pb01]